MNFDKQTDILIVVTLNHSFFYSPKKYRLWQRIHYPMVIVVEI